MSIYRHIAGLVREQIEKSQSFTLDGETCYLLPPIRGYKQILRSSVIMTANDIARRAGVSEIFDIPTILAAMEIKFDEAVMRGEWQ